MKRFILWMLLGLALALSNDAQATAPSSKILVLDFDCHGRLAGKASVIGDSLRAWLEKAGGDVVSGRLVRKTLRQKGWRMASVNHSAERLRALMMSFDAGAAVAGQINSTEGLLTLEMRYLDSTRIHLFEPVVFGNESDLYSLMPELARLILSPDRDVPEVVSVEPEYGRSDVSQHVEMRITFSEPMNPFTFSLYGEPEGMWDLAGDVKYERSRNSFVFKLRLYPGMRYKFRINGERSKGFKDLAGNPADEYIWSFSTGR